MYTLSMNKCNTHITVKMVLCTVSPSKPFSITTAKLLFQNPNKHDLGVFLQIMNVSDKQLVEPLGTLFPWMEYIPRAGWTPEGNR